MNTKQEIRVRLIAQRVSLDKDSMDAAGDVITRAFIDAKLVEEKNNILCYIPVNNEVETKLLIDDIQALHKRVYVPAYDKDKGKYVFALFTGWDNLAVGPYDVMQPADSQETNSIDIAILPGVAFDIHGNRLGYGKGVYDKLLAGSDCVKVGFAYDFQVVDELPVEEHDLDMDMVITEKRIIGN
jgi:5-formyltetrahydrofolate cyclo-ligase